MGPDSQEVAHTETSSGVVGPAAPVTHSEKKGERFMTPSTEASLFFSTDCRQQTWSEFWHANLNALFQMALLLTADPQEAEANLTSVIDAADMSRQPGEDALATLQTAVARYGIERAGAIWPEGVAEARSMLQADLWPVLQVERYPRFCFVLRIIFGLATSTCAGILGISEGNVKLLLRTAVLQLHSAQYLKV
jgi:hypothetical protein